MKRLRIDVPATSANLGPGFDTLGLALDVVDTVHIDLDPASEEIALLAARGENLPEIDPYENLLCRAYCLWGRDQGVDLPGARFTLESRIPVGRGLGSSAAAIVTGLAAAAAACGAKDSRDRRLRLAMKLECHPDNVVAATLGGLTAVFMDGEEVRAIQVASHLSLGVALFVPADPLPTLEARDVLPSSVPMADAVFDLGRLAYLTAALTWGRWDLIGPAMEDCLHQPYRRSLIPVLDEVIAAAREAGAYGAALSGGGPSVIALGPSGAMEGVAASMEARARDGGWEGRSMVTRVRQAGVQVTEEKEGQ
jgi:homoserine kinase